MAQKGPSPLDQRLTLTEAQARIDEIKAVKQVEGKGTGAARPEKKYGAGKTPR